MKQYALIMHIPGTTIAIKSRTNNIEQRMAKLLRDVKEQVFARFAQFKGREDQIRFEVIGA